MAGVLAGDLVWPMWAPTPNPCQKATPNPHQILHDSRQFCMTLGPCQTKHISQEQGSLHKMQNTAHSINE